MTSLHAWLSAYSDFVIIALAVLVVLLTGVAIWMVIKLLRLQRHYRTITTGTSGGNLEALLEDHVRQIRDVDCRVQELDRLTQRLDAASYSHLQHVGMVRFNPFRETGGDQSFVLAVADANGNGAVISSLHMRDITRVYAKALAGWQSNHPLSEEEQMAIGNARLGRR